MHCRRELIDSVLRSSTGTMLLKIEHAIDGDLKFGVSDHMTFQDRGVRALHLFTGLHDDYHRPTDDF